MTALIDLHLIQRLEPEAHFLFHNVQCSYFNWNRSADVKGEDFITRVKMYHQAYNLDEQLTNLFEVSTQFAQGRFEEYRIKAIEEGQEFNPFAKLISFFVNSSHSRPNLDYLFNPFILPPKIEQYIELIQMVQGFSESQKRWRQSIGMEHKEREADEVIGIDEDIETELYEIAIDHCLDGYNEFYQRVRQLIYSYQKIDDVQGCATQILGLFKASGPIRV
ncbi:hypothetical protein GCM10028803_46210 [Larkinella knui]|uniref:Uncharacterized protein n=1 Tax=Larkinella knui TaxID=2025310 RepID=A0A3P1CPP4_9BACT|nr:hypothetical protein [Larkinella knui]RRB15219.1 hypothetical protein EHT87_11795 [Larkinella knui]